MRQNIYDLSGEDFDDDYDDEPISYFDFHYENIDDIDSTSETEIDLRRQGYSDYITGLKGSEVQFLLRRLDRRKHTPVA
jgi:hypothetical protein